MQVLYMDSITPGLNWELTSHFFPYGPKKTKKNILTSLHFRSRSWLGHLGIPWFTMVLTSEKTTFVMNGGCDFPMCQKKKTKKKLTYNRSNPNILTGACFLVGSPFSKSNRKISPHRSSWIQGERRWLNVQAF